MEARPFGSAPTAAKGLPSVPRKRRALSGLSFWLMPTTRIDGSLARSTRSGCSWRQGAHQEAQTFTTVIAALQIRVREAGHGLAVGEQAFERREAEDRRPACRSGPRAPAAGSPARDQLHSRRARDQRDEDQRRQQERAGASAGARAAFSHGATSGRSPRASRSASARDLVRWSITARRIRPATTRAVRSRRRTR